MSIVNKVKKIFSGIVSKFKALSFKKKVLLVVFLVILLIIANQTIFKQNKAGFTTVEVKRGDITEVVTETGNVSASGRTDVYSPTNGIVEEVYVANGEMVVDGQELFKVESSATIQQQQAAYSNYLAAKASLDDANAAAFTLRSQMYGVWDTYYDLSTGDRYENGDGTPKENERLDPEFQAARDDWAAAEKQYKEQQTAISQAQASVSSTWLLYQATQNSVVKSPIAGAVSNLSLIVGSSVKIESPTISSPPALTIAKPSIAEVVVSLSETDIAKVKEGQDVKIDIGAINDKTFKGIVRRVDSIGTSDQGVIRYRVYIELLGGDDQVRPGMTADVEIVTNKLENVLSVPNSAVKPYQGGRAVRVPDKGGSAIKYVPVRIGVRGETRTQILKGIDEGQRVITTLSNDQLKRPSLFGS